MKSIMNKTNTEVRKSTHPFFHHCLTIIKDDWLGPRCAICLMSTTSVLWEPDRRWSRQSLDGIRHPPSWLPAAASMLPPSLANDTCSVCATPIYIRILTTGFVETSTLMIILLPPHTKLPTAALWKIRQNRSRKYQHYYRWRWSN